MNEVPSIELPLMERSTRDLLIDFGSGGHTPGSGSAAALMGLLSARLTQTVCKITCGKGRTGLPELDRIAELIEDQFLPNLERMFQEDADQFDGVIRTRKARDNEEDPAERRRLRERALRQLENATELVVEIAELCLTLAEYATTVFKLGAQKVRGDSGGAISSAIAGASTGVFVAYLNLRSFAGGYWAASMLARVNILQNRIADAQQAAFALAANLEPELDIRQLSMFP